MRIAIRKCAPIVLAAVSTFVWTLPAAAQAPKKAIETPAQLVATYDSLATAILSVKTTEANLVRSILGAAFAHAMVEQGRALQAVKANDVAAAKVAIDNLATDVAQLATEGDNAVGAVRKRLLEGGHHHNAAGEAKGVYEEGYVVVTRAAKKTLLDSSRAIAQLAAAPKAEALDAEWAKVTATVAELLKP
jgi:hypothetical protein